MMQTAKKVEHYITEHMDEFLDELRTVVNLESHTYGAPEIKDQCGLYLKYLFEHLGFEVECITCKGVGTHIMGRLGKSDDRVLLVGHYDTVFPIGTTRERPFSMDDSRAYGPGIYDMKGGLISFYFALKALHELDIFPQGREIDFFFNCDEESGSATSKDYIMLLAQQAKAALVAEPGHSGEGYVTSERFGRSVVTIKAIGEAGHAGNRPEYAANPLLTLSEIILYLESLCDKRRGIWYSPVCLHGGDVGATAMTPAEACVVYDIRFLNEALECEANEAISNLDKYAKKVKLEITGGREKPPFSQDARQAPLLARAGKIVEELGYSFMPTRLGGGSDCNFIASVGCPTLCGLGLNGDFLHNPKEYVELGTIPVRVALLAELIRTA